MGAVSAVTWLSQSDSQSQAAVAAAVAAAAAVLEGFGTKAVTTSSSRSSMLHASFSCTVNLNSICGGNLITKKRKNSNNTILLATFW